jgi:hypothetical protein
MAASSPALHNLLTSSEEAREYFLFSEETVEATEAKPEHKVRLRRFCAQRRFIMQRTCIVVINTFVHPSGNQEHV